MNFRISTVLCWAVLIGFAAAAQNNQRSSKDFNFNNDDDEFEGSGHNSELNQDLSQDLESSGSGLGSDDEDDHDGEHNQGSYEPPIIPPKKVIEVETEKESIEVEPPSVPTEDYSVTMNKKAEDRPTSFFAQPGILAAVIGGAVVGLLCAILVVMFIVYRMRKKDEGSYALGEPKQSPNSNSYSRGTNKEFFA